MTTEEALRNFQSVVMGLNKMNDQLAASVKKDEARRQRRDRYQQKVSLRKCNKCGGAYYMAKDAVLCTLCEKKSAEQLNAVFGQALKDAADRAAKQYQQPMNSTQSDGDYELRPATDSNAPDAPLSCPCCGGAAQIEKMGSFFIYVKCTDCGLKTDNFEKSEEAVACWNKRPSKNSDARLTASERQLLGDMAQRGFNINDLISLQMRAKNVEAMLGDGLKDISSTIMDNQKMFDAKPGDKIISVAAKFLRGYALRQRAMAQQEMNKPVVMAAAAPKIA